MTIASAGQQKVEAVQLGNRSRLLVWPGLAALIGITFLLSDFALVQSQAWTDADVPDLGAKARQAVFDIFRNRDSMAIDRFFSDPFVQHDPNIADGLSGLRTFVTEVKNSGKTNVTVYRTVVDGETVMLHSKRSRPGTGHDAAARAPTSRIPHCLRIHRRVSGVPRRSRSRG